MNNIGTSRTVNTGDNIKVRILGSSRGENSLGPVHYPHRPLNQATVIYHWIRTVGGTANTKLCSTFHPNNSDKDRKFSAIGFIA